MSTEKTADEKPKRGWWPFGGSSSDKVEDEAENQQGVTARKGRATPGRRAGGDDEEGNLVTRSAGGIREYFEGVVAELQKVTWPTREEAYRLSGIVLATTVLASLILGLVALGYSEMFRLGLSQPVIFLGFFVIVLVTGFVLYRRSSNRSNTPPY
jgi:preprotein translocase subunit SecE